MVKNTDCLPGSRAEVPAMCRTWFAYLIVTLRSAWGIPAEALLVKAQDEAERTHVIAVECLELDPKTGYGYAIYAGIMPPGGATMEQAASEKHYLMQGLFHYRFTRRSKEKILFDGLCALPVREQQRRAWSMVADCFSGDSVTWAAKGGAMKQESL